MNLQNCNITVREILANQEAKKLINREFPNLLSNPMIGFAKNMPLKEVLKYANKHIPQQKINQLLHQLEQL